MKLARLRQENMQESKVFLMIGNFQVGRERFISKSEMLFR